MLDSQVVAPHPGRGRRRWWPVLAVLAVLAGVVAYVGYVAVSSPEQATDPGNIDKFALDSLFLPVEQVGAILADPSLASVYPGNLATLYGDDIIDNDCVGVRYVASERFYANGGWQRVSKRYYLSRPFRTTARSSDQALIAFRDAGDAEKFRARAADSWIRCAGRTINVRERRIVNQDDELWSVGPVSSDDGILTVTLVRHGEWARTCQRALGGHENVIIDVDVCDATVDGSPAVALVRALAERIDAGR